MHVNALNPNIELINQQDSDISDYAGTQLTLITDGNGYYKYTRITSKPSNVDYKQKKIKMSKPKQNECDGLCAIAAATDHVNMQTVAQPMETTEGFALNQNRFMDLFKSFWMNMYKLIMHMSTE